MLLKREDYQTIDALLQKVGFRGYYGLTDSLKDAIVNLAPNLEAKVAANNDLLVLVDLLVSLTQVYGADTSAKPAENDSQ